MTAYLGFSVIVTHDFLEQKKKSKNGKIELSKGRFSLT